MKILAHRGMWQVENEKNSVSAISKALEHGFGVETDLRDYKGEIVISHDMATAESIPFKEYLHMARSKRLLGQGLLWALNIKADGLERPLAAILQEFDLFQESFVFDMSIPTAIQFVKNCPEIKLCSRISDVEPQVLPFFLEKSEYIWVDSFYGEKVPYDLLRQMQEAGKKIVFVSDELHRRENYREYWQSIKKSFANTEGLYLCTDYPLEAAEFFKGRQK